MLHFKKNVAIGVGSSAGRLSVPQFVARTFILRVEVKGDCAVVDSDVADRRTVDGRILEVLGTALFLSAYDVVDYAPQSEVIGVEGGSTSQGRTAKTAKGKEDLLVVEVGVSAAVDVKL